MEEIVIRPAQPEDAQVIQTIVYKGRIGSPGYQKVFGESLANCKELLEEKSLGNKTKQIESEKESAYYTIAEYKANTQAIGICHGYDYCKSKELLTLIVHPEEYGELKGLYIDPTVQSKGIGTLLLQDFEQWLISKGKKKCIIRTLSDNSQSNGFYKKNGYQDTGKKNSLTMRDITARLNIYIKDL